MARNGGLRAQNIRVFLFFSCNFLKLVFLLFGINLFLLAIKA